MAKDNVAKYIFIADNEKFLKSLEQNNEKLEKMRKTSKGTAKEVNTLANSFSNASNQVAILQGPLGPVAGRLSAIATGLRGLGVGGFAAAGALTVLSTSISKMVSSLDTFEQRQLRFNSLLEITGNRSGATAVELEKMAQSFAANTLASVAEGASGLEVLISQTEISKDRFASLLQTAYGVQEITGRNFSKILENIAKAMVDPARNATTLASSLNFELTPATMKQIKAFTEMGDKASAVNLLLDEVGDKYSKFATRNSKLQSSLDTLGQSWDNYWEALGRTGFGQFLYEKTAGAVDFFSRSLQTATEKHLPAIEASKRLTKAEERYNDVVGESIESTDTLGERVEKLASKQFSFFFTLLQGRNVYEELAQARKDAAKEEQEALEKEEAARKAGLKSALDAAQKEIVSTRKLTDELVKVSEVRSEGAKQKVERQYQDRVTAIENATINEVKALRKVRDASIAAGEDSTTANAVFLAEKERLEKQFTERLTAETNSRNDKIANIDRVANDKRVAEQQRAFRRLQNINIALAGGDEEARITANYETQLAEFEMMNLTVQDAILAGYEGTADGILNLQTELNLALFEKYEEDLNRYRESQKAKIDSAGIMASIRSQFDTSLDSDGSGFFGSFFDIDLETSIDKISKMESALIQAQQNIMDSELENPEKIRLSTELGTKFAQEQAEIRKQSEIKAATDTWDALQTLGATGNKKLFALAKAGKIAQSIMNTYQAATNALANIPAPFNVGAAAVITAAGFANVASIRAQQPPQFHDGISTVPREGTYLLDGGERVLDSRLNGDLKDFLNRTSEVGSGATSIEFNVTATDTGGFDMWYNDNRDMIVRDIEYARSRG